MSLPPVSTRPASLDRSRPSLAPLEIPAPRRPAPLPSPCRPPAPPSRRASPAVSVALALFLAATAAAAPSFAQQRGQAVSPEAAASASASQLYGEGVAAAKTENWSKAYESFLAAWKIKQHYQIGAQLGRAELKLGKHRDAAEHLSFLLREVKDITPDDRAAVQQMLDEAKSKIATLKILVNREGAEVLIDGAVIGVSPLSTEIYVEPGSRTIEARAPGELAQKMPLELEAGQSRQVGLRFGVKEETPPPGRLPAPLPVPAEGQDGGPNKVLIGVGLGLGAIAIGLGAVTTALSFAKAGDRNDECGKEGDAGYPLCDSSRWDEFETSRTTLANVALASFLGGGIVLGGTIGYAVAASKPTPQVTATLRLRRDGPGVAIAGSW